MSTSPVLASAVTQAMVKGKAEATGDDDGTDDTGGQEKTVEPTSSYYTVEK